LQFFLQNQISIIGPSWKKGQKFTGAHMCTQTQLIMKELSKTNMPIIKNQVQLGALKV